MRPPALAWMGRALACVAVSAAFAADGAVSLRQSSLVATFKQQHAPVDATFKSFSGSIAYDPAKPAATVATLTVDMNSLDVGDDDTNAEVRKAAWFDSAHFPQASFHSTAVTPGAAGHFQVSGTLAIKGHTQPVTLTVSVQPLTGAKAFDGSFELSRKAFGIGDPSWEGVLDDQVRVRFHLVVAET
jgi:polyisoprenoid-binding protein YceI